MTEISLHVNGVCRTLTVDPRMSLLDLPPPPAGRSAYRKRFATVPETQKALSLLGKDLDLRKLVAGAGFEPATSGL